ncbi:MAG: hypothetical protein V4509_03145 [Patescibacteria group bacterium]
MKHSNTDPEINGIAKEMKDTQPTEKHPGTVVRTIDLIGTNQRITGKITQSESETVPETELDDRIHALIVRRRQMITQCGDLKIRWEIGLQS